MLCHHDHPQTGDTMQSLSSSRFPSRFFLHGAALPAMLLLAACAAPTVDAQWRNIELPPGYLRGATVLVSCEAGDFTLKRICEDQLSADLSARGVRPVLAPPPGTNPVQPGAADIQYLPAARQSGARALISMSIGLSSQSVSQGVSVGIGGFGFGRHSAGGVGISAPIGGGRVNSGYSVNSRVTDANTGRLMWTARASTPPSSDVNAQLADLSKSVLDAAGNAGLF
jgi:hypothetical protein